MSQGVLIFQGMTVGFLPGDLEISIDEAGNTNSKVILSTSYKVIPIWLRVANDNVTASKTASEALKQEWCDDPDKQKALLVAELAPSMQVIVSCGIALDSLYDLLRPHAKISQADIDKWKEKRTSRGDQIAEIIRRVFKIKSETLKEFKKGIKNIIKFRDMAVHPTNEIRRSCVRPDVPVGVDWLFSAYKFANASNCFTSTMQMFVYLYEQKCKVQKVDNAIENIFLALQELGVVTINA